MKRNVCVFFVCALFVQISQAKTVVLPGACGSDNIRFSVKTEKNQPQPAQLEAGKAQIVILRGGMGPFIYRFGVDGVWVGADKNNSYFTLSVTPGVHNLCVAIEANLESTKNMENNVGIASFKAEAGKTYYYTILRDLVEINDGPAGRSGGRAHTLGLHFVLLADDEGKYRLETSKLSVWKEK